MIRISNVRKTTKFKRSIKAISPVIATLLMIAIAVVASLVVYAWVTGYIGGTTSTAGKAIQIQSVYRDPTTGLLTVYVQNVGQGTVEFKSGESVYVGGNLVSITSALQPLAAGQTAALVTNYVIPDAQKDASVDIKVTTTDGTFMTRTGTIISATNPSPTINPLNYNIVVTQTANGAIAPAGTTSYAASSTPSFTITPNSGYHIASVTTNAGAQALTSPYVFPALSADGTLTATFAADAVNYNIVVTQTANGAIAPAGTTSYAASSTPSFTITPNSGYHIASVTTNAGAQALTSPYVFPALSADGTLTATFAADAVNYNIVVTQTANGAIAPAGTTSYAASSTPSFTITPNSGYHIASVTTNAGAQALTSPYVFPALSADGTLTATFAANTFGNTNTGTSGTTLSNYLVGVPYAAPYTGTAQSISAYITLSSNNRHIKAGLYSNTGVLLGSTNELTGLNSGNQWVTMTFTGTKPTLTAGTTYILVVWADSGQNSVTLYYSQTQTNAGRYYGLNYAATWPTPVTFTNNNNQYCIYCTYSIP